MMVNEFTRQQIRLERVLNQIGFQTECEKSFPPFIVDCYIPELHVAVEVDGAVHQKGHDKKRDAYLLDNYSLKTYRFSNEIIEVNSDEEIGEIVKKCLLND